MELNFVTDDTRTHNSFFLNGRLANWGKPVEAGELSEFICDLSPIEVNEHIEILRGQYVQVWLPDMEGPDQVVIPEDVEFEEVEEFLETLPEKVVVILGSKYPKFQEIKVYHKVGTEWHAQMEIQLDMSNGDSILFF